ncbi:NUDIX hydrolase domain-like protein [Amylocarpus encephaloides]|uniref:NUDIX hydrolase domain-like protein n=1 Tax=Amylocarpus encephaloides TaxID=45428 RepID=A0A9P7YF75_9HELO|nr:NUDIX hydrolase domain-like protein [Amylocarpus encephaloides]
MTTQNLSPQVRVGVGVFILKSPNELTNNPRFLLGKRLGSHGAGTFALPGGHLEFGETPDRCAIREIAEETGLDVTNVRFLTATNDYMKAEGKHYITMFVTCVRENETEPQVLEPNKCEFWEWASWEQLMGWVKMADETGEGKSEVDLFLPLVNLVRQRPGIIPTLE